MFCLPNGALAQCPFTSTPVIHVSGNITSVCQGDTLKISFSWSVYRGFVPTSPYQYQLYVNGLLVNSARIPFLTQIQPGDIVTGQVSYNGCSSQMSNQLTGLSIIPLVTPAISIVSTQNGPACPGSAVTYVARAVNGGLNATYDWQVNGTTVALGDDSVFTSTILKDGDRVNCILGVNNGTCLVSRNAYSDTLTTRFIPETAPSVTISASANNVYTGVPITFTAIALNSGSPTDYHWQVNGVDTGPDSASFTSSILNNGDVVTCIVTTDIGCAAVVPGNKITVSILPSPPITFPNTFTPNGDGINDTWKLSNLSFYPNLQIKVFNRYGSIVFQSRGYTTPWDGTAPNKAPLPDGVYYYVIDPGNKGPQIGGWVAIIR